jgi:putative transcription factor
MEEDSWNKVTYLRKPKTTSKEARTESAVNRAMASGAPVEITKKFSAGTNKTSAPSHNVSKIADETEIVKLNTVSLEVAKAIQVARARLNLSQKDLATKINEKPQVIGDYEAARALPNQNILGKLERILGVKLRGSNIGSSLK